jgi:hypothetical protein
MSTAVVLNNILGKCTGFFLHNKGRLHFGRAHPFAVRSSCSSNIVRGLSFVVHLVDPLSIIPNPVQIFLYLGSFERYLKDGYSILCHSDPNVQKKH